MKNKISFCHVLRRNWSLYLLVMIPVIHLLLFKYWPMYGAQIAFRDYKPALGILESPWVGWKHFKTFFDSHLFCGLLKNTLLISLYGLATFPLPIILAILLHYVPSRGFRKTVQLVSYFPYFISTVVMVGMILQFLDTREGVVNMLLNSLGIKSISCMGKAKYFYGVYTWTGVWQTVGYSSVIYISALSGVSPELHEAAIVDGATILKRIWHIDIPTILPTVVIMLVLSCGNLLNVGYEKAYLMQNPLNLSSSEIIQTYVYKQGLTSEINNYSYAAAIGMFVSVVNLVLLVSVNRISKSLSGIALW